MDYLAFIQELRDAHGDTIEILSDKLVAWLTTAGTTTFELSSGDFTIQNLPNIEAGNFTVEAGANISVNAPVKLYNDGGTVKAKELAESTTVESAIASGTVEGVYYSSTFDRLLIVYNDGAEAVKARIGTIASDGTISFGAESTIRSAGTSISYVKISKMNGSQFVVTVIDDGTVCLIGGEFTDASTLSLGVELDATLSDVVNYKIASDETDKLALVTIHDDTSANYTLESRIYDFTTATLAIAMTVGSDDVIYTSADYGNDLIWDDSAFDLCYNSTDDVFHSLYSYGDVSGYITYLMHVQIDPDGTLSTPNAIYTLTSPTTSVAGYWFPRGLFWDEGNEQLLVYLPTVDVLNTTYSIYAMRAEIISDDANAVRLTYLHSYKPTEIGTYFRPNTFVPYYDAIRGETYVIYKPYGVTSAFLLKYNAQLNDDRYIESVTYNSSANPTSGITKTVDNLVFGAGTKIYSYSFDERNLFVGCAIETETTGDDVDICLRGHKSTVFVGLIPGSVYYLQKNLSISTSKNEYPVGIALSTTSMQIF